MRFFAVLARWFHKLFERLRARALLAQRLPRGLGTPQLRPALRVPRDSSRDEFETIQLGAAVVRGSAPRRLLRLAALRRRAPVSLVDPRAFRLDPRELTWANEDGIPLSSGRFDETWLEPTFRRDVVDKPRMTAQRMLGLAPLQAEWFAAWWWQHKAPRQGASGPREFETPSDLPDLMHRVKEQLLIRRDVAKDKHPPEPPSLEPSASEPRIAAHTRTDVKELIPPKEWPAGALPRAEAPMPPSAMDEAYFQWRVLMDALADR
jgi:hypothetical protein